MARRGPPLKPLKLSKLESAELRRRASDSDSLERARLRASIILLSSSGVANEEVARALNTTGHTVRKWRKRFIENRLDGLFEAARSGAPKQVLMLNADEREVLERYVRRGTTANRLAQRARMILRCADGLTNSAVAADLGSRAKTVGKWRRRFIADGVDGLHDGDRPGAERKIGDDKVEEVIVLTLETMPIGAARWSTRLMAKKVGISRQGVSRIWRAFGLKPHRVSDTFQLSSDPLFIEKVRDVVGLYMSPPDNAVVLSVDEKSQIQALNRTQPMLPLRPGQLARRTPEYKRNGTTTLFAALDVATSQVIGKCYQNHRSKEFVNFLRLINKNVAPELGVHVILDNYATHKTPAVHRFLVAHPRFELHFIPTHSSWLNLVESWFAKLTSHQLKPNSHHSVRELEQAIHEHIDANNDDPTPFKWTKTADEILEKVARHCDGLLNANSK